MSKETSAQIAKEIVLSLIEKGQFNILNTTIEQRVEKICHSFETIVNTVNSCIEK